MKLSVIIPVYNELPTLEQAFKQAKDIEVIDKEIIIIDNCSVDGSINFLKKINDPQVTVILQGKNFGIGKSIEIGIQKSKGDYIYVYDSDLEYNPRDVLKMLELAEKENLDVVLGSRIKDYKGSKLALVISRPGYLATLICSALINRWYKRNFTDIIGSKLFKTSSVKQLPISTYGAGFVFEHVSLMCKKNFKIGEVQVDYRPREINEKSKSIRPYHIINALWALLKVRFSGSFLEKNRQ